MFLAPNFFGGRAPEFLESIYKIDTGSDHVAVSRRSAEGARRFGGEKKEKHPG